MVWAPPITQGALVLPAPMEWVALGALLLQVPHLAPPYQAPPHTHTHVIFWDTAQLMTVFVCRPVKGDGSLLSGNLPHASSVPSGLQPKVDLLLGLGFGHVCRDFCSLCYKLEEKSASLKPQQTVPCGGGHLLSAEGPAEGGRAGMGPHCPTAFVMWWETGRRGARTRGQACCAGRVGDHCSPGHGLSPAGPAQGQEGKEGRPVTPRGKGLCATRTHLPRELGWENRSDPILLRQLMVSVSLN